MVKGKFIELLVVRTRLGIISQILPLFRNGTSKGPTLHLCVVLKVVLIVHSFVPFSFHQYTAVPFSFHSLQNFPTTLSQFRKGFFSPSSSAPSTLSTLFSIDLSSSMADPSLPHSLLFLCRVSISR